MKQKIVIFRDEVKIKTERENIESVIPFIQRFIQEAKNIDLEIDSGNILRAVGKPVAFAKEEFAKLIPQESVGKFKKKKSAILDDLELPDLSDFEAAANRLGAYIKGVRIPYSYFEINSGKVVVNEKEFERVVNAASVYVENKKQEKLWKLYKNFFDSINSFNDFVRDERIAEGVDLANIKAFLDAEVSRKNDNRIMLVPRWSIFDEMKDKLGQEEE